MSQSHDPDDEPARVTPASPIDSSTDAGAFAYLERDDDGPRGHEPTQPLPQDTSDTRPIATQPATHAPTPQGEWGIPSSSPTPAPWGVPPSGAAAPQWGQPPAGQQGWGQVLPAAYATDVDTTPTRAGRLAAWLTAALAAIALIACFGTWAHASVSGGTLGEYDVTVNGFGYGSAHNTRGAYNIGVGGMTIGYVIAIVSVLTIILAILRGLGRLSRGPMWVAAGLMGLGGILTLVQLAALSVRFASVKRDLLDLSSTIHYSASSGWGLTLAIVATLTATAAAVVSAVKR